MQHFNYRFFHSLLGLGILFSFSSCTLHRLDIQTQYLTLNHLASFHIDTPDPHLYQALIGERLLIQWSLSSQEIQKNDVFLHLKVRFRNHQEQEVRIPVKTKRGIYTYQVNHDLYCQTGGILTYFAEIQSPSCVLASWQHPLWVKLIQFNIPEKVKSSE